MAESPQNEAAKKQYAEEKKRSDKTRAASQQHMANVKPTPTQEENDLAALGAHVIEKEDDGSGPDPNVQSTHQRSMESSGGAGYQTRQAQSKPAAPRHE